MLVIRPFIFLKILGFNILCILNILLTVNGIIVPSNICMSVVILGVCKYVTLHCKRAFKNVLKLRILTWEIILNCLGGPNFIRRILFRERQQDQSERKREDRKVEAEVGEEGKHYTADFENEGRSNEPKNVGNQLRGWRGQGNRFFS